MGKRVLIYSDNFYPLQGGAEKHLDTLITRLIEDGYQVEVITMIPKVEGFNKEFTYPIHRIITEEITKEQIGEISVSEFMWGANEYAVHYFNTKNNKLPPWKQTELAIINIIEGKGLFDVYIGCGQFGAKQHELGEDIIEKIKEKNPKCKTFYLEFDMYHHANPQGKKWLVTEVMTENPLPNINYIMSSNEYDLNHSSIINQNAKICLPPIIDAKINSTPSREEWEQRPYDFGFISPLYHKGSSIVKSLLIDYPNSRFLIKAPSYGTNYDIDNIYPLLGGDYDRIGWVENLDTDFYQQCKFILYPSLNEGYGMVAIEAFCNGAIPIMNSTPSNKWVNGECCYYIESKLSSNPVIYHFDWYIKNYEDINSAWSKGIAEILRTNSNEHMRFIKYYQEEALNKHQQRFEEKYREFIDIISEEE